MSRRSNRRTVKVRQTVSYESSESENSDNDMGWLEVFAMAIQNSRRKGRRSVSATSRKRSTPRKTQKKASSKARTTTINDTTAVPLKSVPNNVSINTSITLDDSILAEHSKKVEDKVESFFKAHNLISDDEDEIENITKKARYPSKDTKEFYELSDSDDDIKKLLNLTPQPSTSKQINEKCDTTVDSIFKDKTNEVIDLAATTSQTKDEELMEVVEKILESTDKSEMPTENDQSWTDFKNKKEEILDNISSLLNEFSKDTQPKPVEPEPPKPASPTKRTCPVCFETLGGDILIMTTTCGHIFCKTCIEHIAKTIRKCPTCRKGINKSKIHPLFL